MSEDKDGSRILKKINIDEDDKNFLVNNELSILKSI